jgi:cytochrome P450
MTTSWALTVGAYHLSANPTALRALRAELDAAGIRCAADCDWNSLRTLPYLKGVVHESIRLAGGVTTRSPRLSPDAELRYGDWVIPKNTPVSMTGYAVLMNESIFPQPRVFRPERWIEDPGLERFFVPFAKGSRQCLGIKYIPVRLFVRC